MSKDILGVSVREARGVIADLLEKLGGRDGNDWLIASKRFLRKENPWDGVSFTPVFSHDMRKEGWTLVEHTPRRITSVANLELAEFLKSGETYVNGEEMLRRARQDLDANYGQEDAEWFLEHQDQIPTEFRKFYLSFPGTVLLDRRGRRCVPCLRWYGGRWCLSFGWLGGEWRSADRLLRPRK